MSVEGNPAARTSDHAASEQPGAESRAESRTLIDEVLDYSKEHPLTAGLAAAAIGVAGGGALRMALGARALLGARAAATSLEVQPLVHLTTAESAAAIAQSGRIGGRYGIFALPAETAPQSGWSAYFRTGGVTGLTHAIPIEGAAAAAFRAPTPVGPWSLARSLSGVRSTPLGSIELRTNTFVPGEIFKNGAFKQATIWDRTKYGAHQWLLDYGIDAEVYGLGAAYLSYKDMENER